MVNAKARNLLLTFFRAVLVRNASRYVCFMLFFGISCTRGLFLNQPAPTTRQGSLMVPAGGRQALPARFSSEQIEHQAKSADVHYKSGISL